jgi:hypothetical protein
MAAEKHHSATADSVTEFASDALNVYFWVIFSEVINWSRLNQQSTRLEQLNAAA